MVESLHLHIISKSVIDFPLHESVGLFSTSAPYESCLFQASPAINRIRLYILDFTKPLDVQSKEYQRT